MRPLVAFVLALLASATAVGADRPIPQDADRMAKRAAERLAWNRQGLAGAYDRVGKKDPRWDKPAREALELAARMFAQQGDPPVSQSEVFPPARGAVEAGCDDPMVLYLHARASVGANAPEPGESARRLRRAADAMAAGGYPPLRRAVALLVATDVKASKQDLTPEERREVVRGLEGVLDLLALSVAEDPRGFDWEEAWDRNLRIMVADYRRVEGDPKAAFDTLDARLAKIPGIDALRLAVKGQFLIDWAWEERTTAFAPGVSAQQFRNFEARNRQARAALEEAWKINPGQPRVARRMLEVEKGIGGGDRQAMEAWFERAMQADGDDRDACWSKLDWLDPKWHGGRSTDEMMAFGKACRATGNWRNGVALLVADAHMRHYDRLDRKVRGRYFFEMPVHAEIVDVFEDHLRRYPSDDAERSRYATLCYMGGYIGQAHKQFQILGDRLTPWPTFPGYSLDILQTFRDTAAKKMAAHQAPGSAPAKP